MVRDTTFEGLKAVELVSGGVKLVAVTELGPRVAFLGLPDGENVFFWDSKKKCVRGDWHLRGGHRVWIARPGADEAEETYNPDNAKCEVTTGKDSFTITTPVDPVNQTVRGFTVKALGDGKVEVENFVKNVGSMLFSASVWCLTCSLPSDKTKYYFPLGDGSEWDCYSMVMFNRWGGHTGAGAGDKQISLARDLMTLEPQGVENKRMWQSHSGIGVMRDKKKNVTFAKKVVHNPEGKYPLGCNWAFYVGPDNFMVEMETMGEETTLKPGQTVSSKEIWVLKEGAAKIEKAADCLALFA